MLTRTLLNPTLQNVSVSFLGRPLTLSANCVKRAQRRLLSQKRLCTAPFPEFDNDPAFTSYEQLYDYSIKNPTAFWDRLAKNRLVWRKPYTKVLSSPEMTGERFEWFVGGKLNATENLLDRHVAVEPNRIALIWEMDDGSSKEITYKELLEQVCQIGNMLKAHGVQRGQRVAIYMPVSVSLVATMLACARIGAVHSVVFAGFSAEALAARIIDSKSRIVVTTDQAIRGGRTIDLKKIVDAALKQCPFVTRVFVSNRTGEEKPNVQMSAKDVHLEAEMAKYPKVCEPALMDSEDPLFLLYTSGSTGRPKGVVHTQAGYLLYAAATHQLVFNYKTGERFGCVADVGWITGHSYIVYGPLMNGATTLLFESQPTYPDPGRYWEVVERLQLNHIYLAPTALRLLLKHGDSWVKKHDRSSLKSLGCVGEPLNHEAWQWYHDVVGEGRCDVIDTWWQTETGGICISPRPSAPGAHVYPAMPGRPFFGINPALFDASGKEVKAGSPGTGSLAMKIPWPGIARTLYGDHERYYRQYFAPVPGHYITGDGARRDENGQYQIIGRTDDVINTSGHRIGTAEVEDAIDTHPAIAESAVVGYPHDIKGEAVYAFVILRDREAVGGQAIEPQHLIDSIKKQVRHKIAGYAVPDIVHVASNLPKTRSGKIMRRILRKVASGSENSAEMGDTSTLADPSVVEVLIKKHKELVQNTSK